MQTFLKRTATATATSLMLLAIVGDVRPMKTMMAFATLRFKAVQMNWRATTTHRQRLTMVLAQPMMSVAFAAEKASLVVTVIAMATNSTPLESVAGPCVADADADGICDDVDPCVGELDACGVCNGPVATYECGCSDIPEGDCDCDGNVLDECGICGGDGIPAGDCDCDGNVLDECGICGGDGIPAGDCDCNGNQLDALGECGGPCVADADADGICDDVDPVCRRTRCLRCMQRTGRNLRMRLFGHPRGRLRL